MNFMPYNKIHQELQAMKEEVNFLLSKGAIKQITRSSAKVVSSLSTVPKRSGGSRPVKNLKPLNQSLHLQTFSLKSFLKPK